MVPRLWSPRRTRSLRSAKSVHPRPRSATIPAHVHPPLPGGQLVLSSPTRWCLDQAERNSRNARQDKRESGADVDFRGLEADSTRPPSRGRDGGRACCERRHPSIKLRNCLESRRIGRGRQHGLFGGARTTQLGPSPRPTPTAIVSSRPTSPSTRSARVGRGQSGAGPPSR